MYASTNLSLSHLLMRFYSWMVILNNEPIPAFTNVTQFHLTLPA